MGQVVIRTRLFPLCQAVLTGGSTFLGVLLVIALRPNRKRRIPFYSDATHNDPERVILACGENLACFFMPLVAVVEYFHQMRLCSSGRYPGRPIVPRPLRPFTRPWFSTKAVVRVNFICTVSTTLFFFTTANLPSHRPFTTPHQLAASGLIVTYSLQSILKAILAETFGNYRSQPDDLDVVETKPDPDSSASDLPRILMSPRSGILLRLWERHHMSLRLLLVVVLLTSLIGTWLTYVGRHVASVLQLANARHIRDILATAMAVIVHCATIACVTLMVIMVIDMRDDNIILQSADTAESQLLVNTTKSADLSISTR